MSCTAWHGTEESCLGEPLCPDCYDYTGSVLFNALAPQLWKYFTDALRRRAAKAAGLTLRELRAQCTISFAKVAEYQRRGVVHFHAVIRLDGPDGPASPPPAWATADMLADAIRHAAHAVTATTSATTDEPARVLRWERQLDVREITMDGELSDQAVAGYIAKYATKAAECVGPLDRRINPLDDLTAFDLRDHPRRLIAECTRLGDLDEYADLPLTQWAHMLGFRGHYSTTMGAIRDERRDHARTDEITTGRLSLLDDDTVLVISTWEYAGKGLSVGDALLLRALTGPRLVNIRGCG